MSNLYNQSKTSCEKLIEIKYNKRINAGTSVPFQKNIYDTLIFGLLIFSRFCNFSIELSYSS